MHTTFLLVSTRKIMTSLFFGQKDIESFLSEHHPYFSRFSDPFRIFTYTFRIFTISGDGSDLENLAGNR